MPVTELVDAFAYEGVERGGVGVEALTEDGNNVAPPLSAFAVWTVEEVVAGVDIDGAEPFVPKAIVEAVVAGEASVRSGVVARFAIGQTCDFSAVLDGEDELVAVEPAEGFVLLPSGTGDVFGSQAFLAHSGMIGLY